ncbi:uncharacterized protein LOC133695134 isoform X3 [Populus nigra]|uniref:uncharacterized protein LOC133695134 isoform X3 n=1 Tax=Populus nigra TaxID=3691 RepID=UPI002B26C577|nr:uncharacterized protein LOC133695134 isoform X3 [Populus nigra]XP_061972956.1 uncharacterized protein LOC133695134 isoform X3 [Populus nigra]
MEEILVYVYYVLLRCTRKHILLRIMWLQMLTMNNSTIKRLLTGSKNFQLMVKWSWCNGLAIYSCMEFQFWQELCYLLKDEKEARFQFRNVQKD